MGRESAEGKREKLELKREKIEKQIELAKLGKADTTCDYLCC